ncbi:hypothetical protein PLESTB_000331500 [Pleodorina starrii]|uniref:Carotenoid oxygenase n=1 Tax=Pleodorina starrii TaxID=330485 RepID=A0A9W6BDB9_9CHLO|nr:hypothetical protein PLESTM_001880500 [Pleodorina starrii]GLC49999.1 hypothetical protein PLESTB_000331500 [Pleodorina starrii]GLC75130.1 hypothetical protein PLESTF_001597200 [Pleodorina starrii]
MLTGNTSLRSSTWSRRGRQAGAAQKPRPRTVAPRVASPTTRQSTSIKEDDGAVRDSSGRLLRRGAVTEQDVRDYKTLFSSLLKEYAYSVEDAWVTGTIPQELYGTYYRNGPGLQVDNPRYQRHTFDGDGMVLSLAFREGRAYFRNRYVRTEGFVQEQAAGRPLYRNSFTRGSADGSPWFNPFDLNFKNVANTGVLAWAGQLYALWEGGLPYRMDPRSLDTLGESRLGGALRGSTFGAHYRVTTPTGVSEPGAAEGAGERSGAGRRWVAFSTETGWGGAAITFYEFAEDGSLLHETRHPLEDVSLPFIHDMLVSEHYYIIVLGPVEFDPVKFATSYVLSRCSIAECLVYNPAKPARVVLVPRPGRPSGRVLSPRVLETQPCFTFHHVNAFEVEPPSQQQHQQQQGQAGGQGQQQPPLVVIDTVAWDEITFSLNQYTYGPSYYNGGCRSHVVRLVCDPASASGSVSSHRLMRRTAEFPVTDPRVTGRPHRLIWTGCDMLDHPQLWGPNQAIARLEVDPRVGLPGGPAAASGSDDALHSPQGVAAGVALDVWYAGDRCFPGEPMFVPRPGSSREGDGWILAAVHNAATQKGEIVILDAQNLSAGPLATIHLPHRLPAGLHGSWDAAFAGPEEAEQQQEGRPGAAPRWQELGTIRAL